MSEALPLVSIVTPVFNQAEYVRETIESVLAQDYPHIEYIVLDDGSTDGTREILKDYVGRFHWETQENMGQARTLNKGWAMSKGVILGYISSDDTLAPGCISATVHTLRETPEAVVSYPDFTLIDANSKSIRDVETENFSYERLRQDLVCQPGPGAFFRRSLLDAIGSWNPELRFVPDFDFWLRASSQGPFVRIHKPLASFRIHERSGSIKPVSTRHSNEIIEVARRFWDGYASGEGTASASRSKAISAAHVISAKSHMQSGRLLIGATHSLRAAVERPAVLGTRFFWKSLASGLTRRWYYRTRMR